MKKKGYYEYIPMLYPHRLYVMIGFDKLSIDKSFDGIDLRCFDDGTIDRSDALTFHSAISVVSGKVGSLVVFGGKSSMTPNIIAHEGFHVLSAFMDLMPLRREPSGSNEHLAYLMGWICGSMNDARKGIGDFIEIKDKEE